MVFLIQKKLDEPQKNIAQVGLIFVDLCDPPNCRGTAQGSRRRRLGWFVDVGYQGLPMATIFSDPGCQGIANFFFLRSRFLEAHTLKIFEVWKMIAPWLTPFPAPTWVQKPQVSREYLRNKHRSLPIYQSTSNMLVTVDSSPRSPDHDALGIDARIQHDTRCMSLAVGTAPRSFRVMGK